MTQLGTISAVRVGRAHDHSWSGSVVRSAGLKLPVDGRVGLGPLGLAGDEQADTVHHGGPEKAVLCYAAANYPRWRSGEGLELPQGAFFENVTLDLPGWDETTVRLGETWRLGSAVVQVSEPRQPCYKLAKRWGIDDLVVRVQRTGMSGWYLRVLETGDVGAGDTVARLAGSAGPTLREASVVVQGLTDDADLIRRVLAFEGLPTRWRPRIERRLAGGRVDESARERGPAADR